MKGRTVLPKLRAVETHWVRHNGQPALLLRDRLGLSDRVVVVPQQLVPLLGLCDGTRDARALQVAFQLRTGLVISSGNLEGILAQLDEALLLEGPRLETSKAAALEDYRQAPYRPPSLAGSGYPAEPDALARVLNGYVEQVEPANSLERNGHRVPRGIICPHIDYQRGAAVYAQTWRRARQAALEADLVVVFGTDHNAGGSLLTLTRQSYATPWGTLPTSLAVIDAVAEALGHDKAFATELHHRAEHSIELAAIWLHHALDGQPRELVPILCGSFEPFTGGNQDPAQDPLIRSCLAALRGAARGRRLLAIAAADLAHVGPAFGDSLRYGPAERSALARHDERMLETVCAGSADRFFQLLKEENDQLRVCGLPPIYMMLRLLGECQGEIVTYAQCPADQEGASIVSIAGAVLY